MISDPASLRQLAKAKNVAEIAALLAPEWRQSVNRVAASEAGAAHQPPLPVSDGMGNRNRLFIIVMALVVHHTKSDR